MSTVTEIRPRPSVPWRRTKRRLSAARRNVSLTIGLVILALWVLLAVFAGLIAPYDPGSTDFAALAAPSIEHPFGTDRLGHDVLTRVIFSAQQDLYLAVAGIAIAFIAGAAIGVAVGYTRRWWGDGVMRLLDGVQAFPLLILALALVQALGAGPTTIIVSLAIINVPQLIRVVRSQVLSIREQRYVEAAVAAGNPTRRVLFRHILPNASLPLLSQATIALAYSILVIAALSFLSVGIQPPAAEWGQMISDGYPALIGGQWWVSIFPGLAVVSVVLAFNLVGDALQQTFSHERSV